MVWGEMQRYPLSSPIRRARVLPADVVVLAWLYGARLSTPAGGRIGMLVTFGVMLRGQQSDEVPDP